MRRSKSVFIGNLSRTTTPNQLQSHVSTSGLSVKSTDILRRSDGSSKCCAIVTFSTTSAVKEAIRLLHGTVLHDRLLLVKEDEPRSRRGYYQKSRAPQVNPNTTVFVSNISFHVDQAQLSSHFAKVEGLMSVKLYSKPCGQHIGRAMLVFQDHESAANAILQFDKSLLDKRILNVRYCNPF
jgi:RNA recognition motif-containing protein